MYIGDSIVTIPHNNNDTIITQRHRNRQQHNIDLPVCDVFELTSTQSVLMDILEGSDSLREGRRFSVPTVVTMRSEVGSTPFSIRVLSSVFSGNVLLVSEVMTVLSSISLLSDAPSPADGRRFLRGDTFFTDASNGRREIRGFVVVDILSATGDVVVDFRFIGAEILGVLAPITDLASLLSSLSPWYPSSVDVRGCWFSLLHPFTLCWMNLTMSLRRKVNEHSPHVR